MQEERMIREDSMEMDLKDIFWSVLRHWRSLLVAVLAVGVVMAGYGAWKEYKDLTNKGLVKKRQETYEAAVEKYDLTREQLDKRLKNLESELARLGYYGENAVMLLIDQYNVYIKRMSFYVDTNYEISPQMVFQNPNYTSVITKSYKAALDRLDLDAVIATRDMPHLTARNPVDSSKKMLLNVTVDDANGVLYVTVRGDTRERVNKIYEAVNEVMESQQELLNQAIGEHSLKVLYEIDETDIDTAFGDLQAAFEKKQEDVNKGIEDTTKSIAKLEKPVNDIPTMKTVARQGVKFGLVGVVLVILCLAFYYAMRMILRDRLNSTEEIRRRYGIPVLGVMVKSADEWKKIDKRLAAKLGINADRKAEDSVQYIASNIRFYLRENKKLLLIGNCAESELRKLKEELAPMLQGVEMHVGGNINESAAAVDALSDKCAVVCVEQWMETPHREIRNEIQTVEKSGNPNLGFVVVA